MTSPGKNILFIEHNNVGGLAHYAHEVCNAMVRQGHNVTLICLGNFEIPPEHRSYNIIECPTKYHATRLGKGIVNLKFLSHIMTAIRKTRAVAVFFDGYQPILSLPLIFSRPRGVSVFCIQHEVEPRIGEKRISYFQKQFYDRVSAMIVHRNTHSKELLEKKYHIRPQIITINHGLYTTDLFGKKQAQDRNAAKTSILSFGTVRADKGLDLLVKAYPGRGQCDGLRLMIAGQAKKEYGEYFAKVIAEKQDVIWNRKFFATNEIGRIYHHAAFVVLPFLECTQSGSLRLAMFFEKPVIASDVGEIPAFIEKYKIGIIVPRGNINALRQAMITLAANPSEREEYVQNIKKLNNGSDLSWDLIIQELFNEISERKLC